MQNRKNNGFALVLVITLMAMLTASLGVATMATNSMSSTTNHAYMRACNRNLLASGAAWVRHNGPRLAQERQSREFSLDTDALAVAGGKIAVAVTAVKDGVRVELKSSCERRRFVCRDSTYTSIVVGNRDLHSGVDQTAR